MIYHMQDVDLKGRPPLAPSEPMPNKSAIPGRFLSWLLVGILVGGLSTAVDGAILGAIFAGGWPGALRWGGLLGAAGALLGALVAAVGRVLAPRLMLGPPADSDADGSST